MGKYKDFYSKIGYSFKNEKFLEQALTHPSCLGKEQLILEENYERLEFLGDAVLSFVITAFLIKNFPEEPEGNLTKRRSMLINSTTLSAIGRSIGILSYLIASNDENFNVLNSSKTSEDATEALLGAIYLDSGVRSCKKFIMKHWKPFLFKNLVPDDDPKSYLQEWSQKRGFGIPQYTLISKLGESHAPIFTIQVTIPGLPEFTATGTSKKMAEKNAAKSLFAYIKSS